MVLPRARRALIDAHVAAGVRARTYPSGLITLQTPNAAGRFVKLGDAYGLNDAGRHYYAAVGEEEPTAGLDMNQQPVRQLPFSAAHVPLIASPPSTLRFIGAGANKRFGRNFIGNSLSLTE